MSTRNVAVTTGALLLGLLVGFMMGRNTVTTTDPPAQHAPPVPSEFADGRTSSPGDPAPPATAPAQTASTATLPPTPTAYVTAVTPAPMVPAPVVPAPVERVQLAPPPAAQPAPARPPVEAAPAPPPALQPAPAQPEPQPLPAEPPGQQPPPPLNAPRLDLPDSAQKLPLDVQAKLPTTAYALSHAPLKGDPRKAKVAIMMYSEFQCPFSAKAKPTMDRIQKEYGEDVVLAFRHFPLEFHDRAIPAAKASFAAHKQGKFWEFHDKLFADQSNLDTERFEQYAGELGLDLARFKADMVGREAEVSLQVDKVLAASAEVDGTPVFLVNGYKLTGALPFESFKVIIDSNISRVDAKMANGIALIQARGQISESNMMRNPRSDGGNGDPKGLRRVPIAGFPSKGAPDPAVAIVAFSDFECPHCGRINSTLTRLLAELPKDLRVVFRNLPLDSHTRAPLAAQASLIAHESGKFWEYHDKLFANQQALEQADLVRYAKELGLDEAAFAKKLASGAKKAQVDKDAAFAGSLGITGTPTLIVNGRLIEGAVPYERLRKVVDSCLDQSQMLVTSGKLEREGYYAGLMAAIPNPD